MVHEEYRREEGAGGNGIERDLRQQAGELASDVSNG
jgi:hypothetical protein